MLNYTIIKKDTVDFAAICLCSDGIVRVFMTQPVDVTPTHLQTLFKAYNTVVEGVKYPFMYVIESDSVFVDADSRAYFRANEGAFPKTCIAVVSKFLPLKLVANFYLKFHKPITSIKLFNTEQEGTEWCLQEQKRAQKTKLVVL